MGVAINTVPSTSNPTGHLFDAIPPNPTTPYQELQYVRLIQSETEVYAANIAKYIAKNNVGTYPSNNTRTLSGQLAAVAKMIKGQLTAPGERLRFSWSRG